MEQKEDTHRNGHTLRRKIGWIMPKQNTLDRSISTIPEGQYITDIDELINDKRFIVGNIDVPFNNPMMWADVQEQLQSSAKSTRTDMNRCGVMRTTYTVPATGFLEKSTIKQNRVRSLSEGDNDSIRYMTLWNEQYYDNNLIYIFNGNNTDTEGILTKACQIYSEQPTFDMPNIIRHAIHN